MHTRSPSKCSRPPTQKHSMQGVFQECSVQAAPDGVRVQSVPGARHGGEAGEAQREEPLLDYRSFDYAKRILAYVPTAQRHVRSEAIVAHAQ